MIAKVEWNAGDDDGDDDDADTQFGVIVRGPLPVAPQNRGAPHCVIMEMSMQYNEILYAVEPLNSKKIPQIWYVISGSKLYFPRYS